MKKLRIYLDTSVISYLKAEDTLEKMVTTQKLWGEIKSGLYEIFLSGIVLNEINSSPEPKRSYFKKCIGEIDFRLEEITEEAVDLAQQYIDNEIIPEKYRDDALHIAIATVTNCNAIISWNFKHMVRLKTIVGVNGINKYMGYREIEILSPDSIVGEEG